MRSDTPRPLFCAGMRPPRVYTRAMNAGEFDRRRWPQALPWFAVTAAGFIFFLLYIGPSQELWAPAIYFPTTSVGIGGGVGAFYGQGRRGAAIALGAEVIFCVAGFYLAISGFEDYRGVLLALAITAGFVWLVVRSPRMPPGPK